MQTPMVPQVENLLNYSSLATRDRDQEIDRIMEKSGLDISKISVSSAESKE